MQNKHKNINLQLEKGEGGDTYWQCKKKNKQKFSGMFVRVVRRKGIWYWKDFYKTLINSPIWWISCTEKWMAGGSWGRLSRATALCSLNVNSLGGWWRSVPWLIYTDAQRWMTAVLRSLSFPREIVASLALGGDGSLSWDSQEFSHKEKQLYE